MQEKKIKFTDVLFVGLAFFASYFGAGNLIFPPMLGLQSGSNWLSGMIGMLASGVGLPILAIIVLSSLNISITSLVAVLSVAGLALSLAIQNLLSGSDTQYRTTEKNPCNVFLSVIV